MLEPLGVDSAALAVYSALLRAPEHSPEQLAEDLGWPVADVVKQLDILRDLELVIPTWTTASVEHAVHPRIGLILLAQRRRTEINQTLAELDEAEGHAEKL